VLRDGSVQPALAKELLRFLDGLFAIYCHWTPRRLKPGRYVNCCRARASAHASSVNRIKQGWRPERTPVQRRVAVTRDGREMIRRRVALVTVVTVARVRCVMREHLSIARHLRDDRRRGNRAAAAV